MESDFVESSGEEEEVSCCDSLLECIPRYHQPCREEACTCYTCCCCCCHSSTEHLPEQKFPHVAYRPVIDSNILTGNTLLRTAGGYFYFPQVHQTLWPEHGSHYKPTIRSSPVVSEQPLSSDQHLRRSTRLLSALKQRKRAHSQGARGGRLLPYNPASPLPSLAHSSIEDPDQPTLTLSVMHDIQSSTLTVALKFACNLNHLFPNPHKQLVHPSISAYLLPSKNEIFQTSPTTESNNPVFNENFVFAYVPVSDLEEHTLVFQVYHGRGLIGVTKIPLSCADLLGFTVCKHIDRISEYSDVGERNSAGDIQIALAYHPESEVIDGAVLRVTNLRQPILPVHSPRPYINVYLIYDGRRYAKWKSSVHYDTAVEAFNELFQFNVSKMDVNLIKLCVHVKEYHRTHFNQLIGVVEIGSTADGTTGTVHWQEVINSPQQKISHWHSIVPVEGPHEHPATHSRTTKGTSRTTSNT